MDPSDLPPLTGNRLDRLMAILKNAPRDPSCGCVILSEMAKQMIVALFREEGKNIDMEIFDGKTQNEDIA
jgi:hypothetical protein